MNQVPALAALAEWLTGHRARVLPADIRHTARRCLVDTLGVMLAGAQQPVAGKVRRVVAGEQGPSRLIGTGLHAAPATAALVNGVAAHALDFDDNCYAGFVHGSAVIVPAALALADAEGARGDALLNAIALGSECQYRLGMALENVLYQRGWWTTGMLGGVGACAAAATLLALDSTQCAHALGIALVSAAGMKAVFGTDSKPLTAGYAAQRGVMAALMAQAGVTGPLNALEHAAGFAALCNQGHWVAEWLRADSRHWCLREPGVDIKRIPLCLSSHAAVDALLFLLQQQPCSLAQIDSVVCDVPEIVRANLVYDLPLNAQQAQFSLPFALAQTLLTGDVLLRHLNDAHLQDERLRLLMQKVRYHSSARWRQRDLMRNAPEGAEVTLCLRDGSSRSHFVAKARGAASVPLSDDELGAKFLQCSEPVLGAAPAYHLLNQLWQIDRLAVSQLLLFQETGT